MCVWGALILLCGVTVLFADAVSLEGDISLYTYIFIYVCVCIYTVV